MGKYIVNKAKLLVRVGQKAAGLLLKIAELHKNAVDGYLYYKKFYKYILIVLI